MIEINTNAKKADLMEISWRSHAGFVSDICPHSTVLLLMDWSGDLFRARAGARPCCFVENIFKLHIFYVGMKR